MYISFSSHLFVKNITIPPSQRQLSSEQQQDHNGKISKQHLPFMNIVKELTKDSPSNNDHKKKKNKEYLIFSRNHA